MTEVGHAITGTAIGLSVMPNYPRKHQIMFYLMIFALLATIPDWPIKDWGHDLYYVSHSIFSNLLLIALGWVIWLVITRLRVNDRPGSWHVSWQIMLAGSAAWLSHLLLDTFYNHAKGLLMFWPVSEARLALPIPWLSLSIRPFFNNLAGNGRVFLLEAVTFLPLVFMTIAIRRYRKT
jgi:hypothetical protein